MNGCPCGSGREYGVCCGPVIDDGIPVETAEQLMRSRYTAFALGREEHLWRTWHPRTRPDRVTIGDVEWTGLAILDVESGKVGDDSGVVEFEARYSGPGGAGSMHERSRFARRGGRWTYVEG